MNNTNLQQVGYLGRHLYGARNARICSSAGTFGTPPVGTVRSVGAVIMTNYSPLTGSARRVKSKTTQFLQCYLPFPLFLSVHQDWKVAVPCFPTNTCIFSWVAVLLV